MQDGGRPSHHPDDVENPAHAEIREYWNDARQEKIITFHRQRFCWQEFREAQDRARARRANPEGFRKWANSVNKYRIKNGIPGGNICLLQDRREQSTLADWKEFQFYEYCKAHRIRLGIEQAGRDLEDAQERLRDSIDAGASAFDISLERDLSVTMLKARCEGEKDELVRHVGYLRWIDAQLLIMESESGFSPSPQLGKRKRSEDEAESSLVSKKVRTSDEDATAGPADDSTEEPSAVVTSRRVTFADSPCIIPDAVVASTEVSTPEVSTPEVSTSEGSTSEGSTSENEEPISTPAQQQAQIHFTNLASTWPFAILRGTPVPERREQTMVDSSLVHSQSEVRKRVADELQQLSRMSWTAASNVRSILKPPRPPKEEGSVVVQGSTVPETPREAAKAGRSNKKVAKMGKMSVFSWRK